MSETGKVRKIRRKGGTEDLTKGNPWKLILSFMWPVLLGGIFQQVYSLADVLIVSQLVSYDAMGAVGSTGPISFLMQSIAMGITSGFAVFTAQRYGAGDGAAVKKSIAANIIVSSGLTVVLTVLCTTLTAPILKVMQVPDENFQYAYDYLLVIFIGFIGIIFYNMFSQLLRALGDSKTPLLFLIVTCALNVGMDFWFIPGMGVQGAALATVLSQLISVVLCMIFAFWRYPAFRVNRSDFKSTGRFYWEHFRIGIPMAFQFSITAIGVIINQTALNTLGTTAIATYTAAQKVEQFMSQTFVAVGLAAATFIAQNFGARNIKRIRQGLWISIIIACVLGLIASMIAIFAGPSILKIFINADVSGEELARIMDYGKIYFITSGAAYICLALLFIFRNALQGVGKSIGTVFGGLAELIMRVVAAFVLVKMLGFQGVCIANPAAWAGAFIIQALLFVYFYQKVKKSFAVEDVARTAENPILDNMDAVASSTAGAVPVTLTVGGHTSAQKDTLQAGAAVFSQLNALQGDPSDPFSVGENDVGTYAVDEETSGAETVEVSDVTPLETVEVHVVDERISQTTESEDREEQPVNSLPTPSKRKQSKRK